MLFRHSCDVACTVQWLQSISVLVPKACSGVLPTGLTWSHANAQRLIGCFPCARSKEVLGLILVKDLVLIDEGLRVSDIRMRPLPFLRADTPMYDLLQARPVVALFGKGA